jgi:hypothetical protein
VAPDQLRLSALELVERATLRRRQQRQRLVECARLQACLGRGQGALRSAARVSRQRCGPLHECSGCCQSTASLCAAGGSLKLRCDLFVEARCRLCPMPRPAIGIGLRIGRFRERLVDDPAFRKRRVPIDHRADQGMEEPDSGPDVEEPSLVRLRRSLSWDPEPGGSGPDESRITDRIGRRQQHQPPAVLGKRPGPASKALLDARRD